MRQCDQCHVGILLARADARFCSTRCRVAWHRTLPKLPVELSGRRAWVRAVGKRPIRPDGSPASSTDPATWVPWVEVHRPGVAGDGYGVMLGGGLACLDLDHCIEGGVLSDAAVDEMAGFTALFGTPLWVERSVSGAGLHVFYAAPEMPGARFDARGVEFYSRARFIRVTGDGFTMPGMS